MVIKVQIDDHPIVSVTIPEVNDVPQDIKMDVDVEKTPTLLDKPNEIKSASELPMMRSEIDLASIKKEDEENRKPMIDQANTEKEEPEKNNERVVAEWTETHSVDSDGKPVKTRPEVETAPDLPAVNPPGFDELAKKVLGEKGYVAETEPNNQPDPLNEAFAENRGRLKRAAQVLQVQTKEGNVVPESNTYINIVVFEDKDGNIGWVAADDTIIKQVLDGKCPYGKVISMNRVRSDLFSKDKVDIPHSLINIVKNAI